MPPTEPATGQAVVYHGPGDIRVEPMTRPDCEAGGVLVAVEACAICGTDVKTWHHGNPRITPPNTMGHEFCGTIVESRAAAWPIGQRITMATSIGCGSCRYCQAGRTNLCCDLKPIGFAYPGAMATWVALPAQAIHGGYLVAVGELSAEIACLAEPTSCAVNDLSHVPAEEVRNALIIGLGPLGLLHTMLLAQRELDSLVACDTISDRLDLARVLGATDCVTPAQLAENTASAWTDGGFDLVVVTAPSGPAQADALQHARKGGYVSLFASLPKGRERIEISTRTIHYNELQVFGSSDSTAEHVRQAVEALRACQDAARRIVTARLPLGQFPEAMQRLDAKADIKVVLRPGGES
jgi:L-iditol 2-dehydrogenase